MRRRTGLKVVRRDRRGNARGYIVEEKTQAPPPPLPPTEPSIIVVESPAFQSHEGASERTSGMDRAKAQLVRTLPLSVVLLILTVGFAMKFELELAWVLVTWGAACALAYLLFDRQEHEFSTNGLERHRIDKAFALRKEEIRHDHELKRMALETHLKSVERYYGALEGALKDEMEDSEDADENHA
jgi:hypothetical protein